MLTPEQLKALPENVVELLQDLEDFLIYDIARRLAKQGELTDTALHQIGRAAGIGTSIKEIEKAINKTTQAAIDDIDRTIRETIDKSIELDNAIYKKAGYDPVDLNKSPELATMLEAGLRQTKKDMYNFTGSMGFTYLQGGKYLFKPITQFYQDTLDLALFQASTGAVDYKTAVRMATKKMTDNGLTFVDYASGHKNRVDVAARRAILTGVNQMNLRMTDSIMDQLGAEYVETTAHMGARPSHQIWQGRVFHMGGPKNGYPGFEEITGYGTGPGLGGWNCRHSYFAFFPGISERNYTDEQLENIDPPPFRYDGKSFSHYEATQEQRRMETDIRKTKREIAAADGLGDKDLMTAKSIKLNQQVNKYRDFSKTAKKRAKMDRTQAYPEFGRSTAQKVVRLAQAHHTKWLKEIGATNSPLDTVEKYYKAKYNKERDYLLLKGYSDGVKTDEINVLTGYKYFNEVAKNVEGALPIITQNGIEIKGYAPHFISRLIGNRDSRIKKPRSEVPYKKVLEALMKPLEIRKEHVVKGDVRQTFIGRECQVTISITDGRLIQTNPLKRR